MDTTKVPGDESFTSALIFALEDLVKEKGRFTTVELLNKIKNDAPNFPRDQTPVLSDRKDEVQAGRIMLHPLPKVQETGLWTAFSPENYTNLDAFKRQTVTLHLDFCQKPSLESVGILGSQLNHIFERYNLGVDRVHWGGMKRSVAARAFEKFRQAGLKGKFRRSSMEQQQVALDNGGSELQMAEKQILERHTLGVNQVPWGGMKSNADVEMLDHESIVDSGYGTGIQDGTDASSLTGSIGLPNKARDEFIIFFAKLMHEHVGSWAEAAVHTCPADYLNETIPQLLKQYAIVLKADAETGLQEQSILAIRKYRIQITRAFTESFDSRIINNDTFFHLHEFAKQTSLLEKLDILNRGDATPSMSIVEEEGVPNDGETRVKQASSIVKPDILNRSGAMPSRSALEEEGISDDEDTQETPIEFSLVKSFLTSNPAFVRFREDLQEKIYYSTGGIMQTIEKEVLDNIEPTSSTIDATLVVCEWEITELLEDQYKRGQSLAQMLLITGTAKQAYAVPCIKYMQNTWPASGQSTLDALDIALAEGMYSM